jgi:hypothetical protein
MLPRRRDKNCPPAHGGCTCRCHSYADVRHVVACCHAPAGPSLQRCGRCGGFTTGLSEAGICNDCDGLLRCDPALDAMTAERDRAWKAHSVMADAYTKERDAREALEPAVRALVARCERILEEDLCDCINEAHQCGKSRFREEIAAVKRML